MKKLIITIILISCFSISFAQYQLLTVATALQQIGKTKTQMDVFLLNKGFKFENSSDGIYNYSIIKPIGQHNLSIAYKNSRVNGIAWNEVIMNLESIKYEIATAKFIQSSSAGSATSYVNTTTNRMIFLAVRRNTRDIFINIFPKE